VIAEGVAVRDGPGRPLLADAPRDEHGHVRLAEVPLARVLRTGVTDALAARGVKVTIGEKDVGYELRCGYPTAFDRDYTRDLGVGAVDALLAGKSSVLITRQAGQIVPVPFEQIIDPKTKKSRVRGVDTSSDSYKSALALQERVTSPGPRRREDARRDRAAANLRPSRRARALYRPLYDRLRLRSAKLSVDSPHVRSARGDARERRLVPRRALEREIRAFHWIRLLAELSGASRAPIRRARRRGAWTRGCASSASTRSSSRRCRRARGRAGRGRALPARGARLRGRRRAAGSCCVGPRSRSGARRRAAPVALARVLRARLAERRRARGIDAPAPARRADRAARRGARERASFARAPRERSATARAGDRPPRGLAAPPMLLLDSRSSWPPRRRSARRRSSR
jgi:hypothetical protein